MKKNPENPMTSSGTRVCEGTLYTLISYSVILLDTVRIKHTPIITLLNALDITLCTPLSKLC